MKNGYFDIKFHSLRGIESFWRFKYSGCIRGERGLKNINPQYFDNFYVCTGNGNCRGRWGIWTWPLAKMKDGYFGIKLSEIFGRCFEMWIGRVRGERVLTPPHPPPPEKKEESLGYQRKGNRLLLVLPASLASWNQIRGLWNIMVSKFRRSEKVRVFGSRKTFYLKSSTVSSLWVKKSQVRDGSLMKKCSKRRKATQGRKLFEGGNYSREETINY